MRSLTVSAGAAIALLVLAVVPVLAADHAPRALLTETGRFGCSVAAVGDVNQDGWDDFIVGAESELVDGEAKGTARVYSGKDLTVLYRFAGVALSLFGASVDGAGDVDADGHPDLVVGAPGMTWNGNADAGAIYLYSGKTGNLLRTMGGAAAGYRMGTSVCAAGDVNGDGYGDILAGAPGMAPVLPEETDGPGRAVVFSGADGSILYQFKGDGLADRFGISVGGGGDVNGDGRPDLIVGAPYDDNEWSREGTVYVYSGKNGSRLYAFEGDASDALGFSVADAADVNADGYADIIAGSDEDDYGLAIVFSGKDGVVLHRFTSEVWKSFFGRSVDGLGDIDGDGFADVIVGSPFEGTGKARVFSGLDGSTIHTLFDTVGAFGRVVAGLGDTNNGGRPDFAVATPDGASVRIWDSRGPTGWVEVGDGSAYAKSTSVSLALSWRTPYSTIKEIRLRDEGGEWGNWFTPIATKSWTLPALEEPSDTGERTIEAEFKDADDHVSPTARFTVVLDTVNPVGSLSVNSDAPHTRESVVGLAMTWQDDTSGVTDVRFRENQGEWTEWEPVAASRAWVLTVGDGLKSIEAGFRDAAGNLSEVYAKEILLDQTLPAGTVALENGAEYTNRQDIALWIDATDDGAGLFEMQLREDPGDGTGVWGAWRPYEGWPAWRVRDGDGPKILEVRVRDAIGNESEVMTDSVIFDGTPPTCSSFSVNGNRPYVLPDEPLEFEVVCSDKAGGAGVDSFTVSYDNGATDDVAYHLAEGWNLVPVARPASTGLFEARLTVSDGAGNRSEESTGTFYLIEDELLETAGAGKLAGTIGGVLDVDTCAVHLSAGDLLTARLRAKGYSKGETLGLAIDLVAPDGRRLVEGRYPADARSNMVKKFPAPETGRYLIVVRRLASSLARSGTYKLSVRVKQNRDNRKGRGELIGSEISFDAPEGVILRASIQGAGVRENPVSVEGPDGVLPVETKTVGSRLKILPTVLDAGTGRYTIRFSSAVTAKYRWNLKLPRKVKATIAD